MTNDIKEFILSFISKLPEDIDELRRCLSPERLLAYEELIAPAPYACVLNIYYALQDYASMLFVPLQYLEVCLRNKTYIALRNFYRGLGQKIILPGLPEEWYTWMPNKKHTKNNIGEAIKRAGKDIRFRPIAPADIVSHLNLGGWASILGERPDDTDPLYFWRATGPVIFPNFPGKKKQIINALRDITTIRNRLSHHEPLWKATRVKEVSYDVNNVLREIEKKYNLIMNFIGWMSLDLQNYLLRVHKEKFDAATLDIRDSIMHYRAVGKGYAGVVIFNREEPGVSELTRQAQNRGGAGAKGAN